MPAIIEFLGAYEQSVIRPASFIRDNYFATRITHEKQKLEIEFRKGRQLVAPFVSELIPGTEMVKTSYASRYYTAPKLAPKRTFTGRELFVEKAFGETIYGGMSGEEKKAKLLADSFAEFEEQITRREEAMCIETLYKGEIIVEGDGVKEKLTYGAPITLTPATPWASPTADIIGDIQAVITDMLSTTGLKPSMITMDPLAAKLFVSNEKIQKLLDVRNYNVGNVAPNAHDDGAIYIGTLAPFNLPIYSYQSTISVLSEDGLTYTSKNLIPNNSVLFAPSKNELHFGSAVDVTRGIIVAERVPFEDTDNRSNTVEIRTESRPLPVPFDIDAFRILTV